MLTDLSELTKTIDSLRSEAVRETKELEKLKVSIQQTRLLQLELIERNTPEIKPPLPIRPSALNYRVVSAPGPDDGCDMETCFDYSRCSLTSSMPVYVYPSSNSGITSSKIDKLCVFHSLFSRQIFKFSLSICY